MVAKIPVQIINKASIYNWLCSKKETGVPDAMLGWNLNMFLIDENGKPLAHFESKVKPKGKEITDKL